MDYLGSYMGYMNRESFVPKSGHPIIDLPLRSAIASGMLTYEYFSLVGIPVGLAVGATLFPFSVALEVYAGLIYIAEHSVSYDNLHS